MICLSNSLFDFLIKMKNVKRTVFRFPFFYENEKRMKVLKIQRKNQLNMKMVVNYLNFVFLIEVKAKSKYGILNFVFQFIKNTKWHFGYTDSTWHARIGMLCILKPLLKSKSNIRKFSAYFTLIFILNIILFYFNSVFSFFSCIAIKKSTSYLRLLKKLPKMVKVIILLSLCLLNLLLCCGDIEKKILVQNIRH